MGSASLTDAWFLESREVRQHGQATVRWLGEGFVELEASLGGEPTWHFVFGRSDADDQGHSWRKDFDLTFERSTDRP